jgi:hypothetical protein
MEAISIPGERAPPKMPFLIMPDFISCQNIFLLFFADMKSKLKQSHGYF